MYILGICKQSINLELIINTLETHNFKKYEIVFLDRLKNNKHKIGDSIRKSDGISNSNGVMCGAMVLMFFGTIWGRTVIPGGPIAIGIGGFIIGAAIGYVIDRYMMGWIRSKLNIEPIKGSNPVEGEALIIVKVHNEEK
ncbi:MAG: hypothetical protein PWQ37_243 [Candidatus Petromonas sp.]|jgi:hypothetical protein|nr:hypothetical protein [Candidatus Petromonas sp.]